MSKAARSAALTAIVSALVACGPGPVTPAPTAPPGGLAEARAVGIARGLAEPHSGSLTVVSAQSGPFGGLGGGLAVKGVPPDRWVWSVKLSGAFGLPCRAEESGGSGAPCPSGVLTHQTVLLDYITGSLIASSLGP